MVPKTQAAISDSVKWKIAGTSSGVLAAGLGLTAIISHYEIKSFKKIVQEDPLLGLLGCWIIAPIVFALKVIIPFAIIGAVSNGAISAYSFYRVHKCLK